MGDRQIYLKRIRFNGRLFKKVVVDQHYREKHPEMTDKIILALVERIDGTDSFPENEIDGFRFYKVEPVKLDGEPFRLVLTVPTSESYLGVVNAFRVRRKK